MANKMLTEDDVRTLAKSAGIQVEAEDIPEYVSSLNKVVSHIEEALQVNTDDIDEISSAQTWAPEELRDDIVSEEFFSRAFLENVPESVGSLVKVPTVIKS